MNNISQEDQIYMDYAAATPVDSAVLDAMKPFFEDIFGNPSAPHTHGRTAKNALNSFRSQVAEAFQSTPQEVIFTSGATEANTLAIAGFLRWLKDKAGGLEDFHIICSQIEHSSVLEVVQKFQQREGLAASFIAPNQDGIITPNRIASAVQENTVFISVMYVNGEIGTVQPISEIVKEVERERISDKEKSLQANYQFPVIHTDATQAPLFRTINHQALEADLISIDSQKIYGPKGVGALYVKSDVELQPLFFGGGQEFGLRSGTENMPLIAGFAKALKLAFRQRSSFCSSMEALQEQFLKEARDKVPAVRLNGTIERRIENNISISFPNRNHDFLATKLDQRGISVATKSACLEGGGEGSPVVSAITKDKEPAGALRFTFGKQTQSKDITYVVQALADACKE